MTGPVARPKWLTVLEDSPAVPICKERRRNVAQVRRSDGALHSGRVVKSGLNAAIARNFVVCVFGFFSVDNTYVSPI
jgi:hypothetical protein